MNHMENIISDNQMRVGDSAMTQNPSRVSVDMTSNFNNQAIDSMRSYPSNAEMQTMGFPSYDQLPKTANVQGGGCDMCPCQNSYNQDSFNNFMNNLFGADANPMSGMLGQGNFDQSMQAMMDLLSGHPENLLKDLGLGGDGGSGGGSGGLFGDIFGGIKGLLGGLLGGGDKGGGSSLLNLAVDVAPLLL